MMPALAVDRPRRKPGAGRRLLIRGPAALGAGPVAAHAETCHALGAGAWRSVTDSCLVLWIERTGAAPGCF